MRKSCVDAGKLELKKSIIMLGTELFVAVLLFCAHCSPLFIPSCSRTFLLPFRMFPVSHFPFPSFLMYPNSGILKVLIMHIERVK
jgi:hypothetical protein